MASKSPICGLALLCVPKLTDTQMIRVENVDVSTFAQYICVAVENKVAGAGNKESVLKAGPAEFAVVSARELVRLGVCADLWSAPLVAWRPLSDQRTWSALYSRARAEGLLLSGEVPSLFHIRCESVRDLPALPPGDSYSALPDCRITVEVRGRGQDPMRLRVDPEVKVAALVDMCLVSSLLSLSSAAAKAVISMVRVHAGAHSHSNSARSPPRQ